MAYIKYKELTKYFNFNKEIATDTLPTYVTDYLTKGEEIIKAYKTARDKGIFTNKRIILFDVNPLTNDKKIHIIPYESISSGSVLYNMSTVSVFFSFDSGYQMKLKFVHCNPMNKTEIRKLFSYIMDRVN